MRRITDSPKDLDLALIRGIEPPKEFDTMHSNNNLVNARPCARKRALDEGGLDADAAVASIKKAAP